MNHISATAFAEEIEKIAEHFRVEEAKAKHQVNRVSDLTRRLRPGDVLFSAPDRSKDKGFLGRVFKPISRLVQGTDYGHAAIYAGNGQIIEGRIGEGVTKKPITKMTGSNNVVATRVNATPEERKAALEYAHQQIGKPFAVGKIIRAATPFRGKRVGDGPEEAHKLICSALVANAYAKKLFSNKSRLMTRPSEIMGSEHVRPVAALTRFNKDIEKAASMEKEAIIGTLALGAGLHVGANLGMRQFRNSGAWHHFEADQMATGLRHGATGVKLHPVAQDVATFGVGPESLAQYQVGRGLGEQMRGMSKGRQRRFLKKLRKNVAMLENVREAPIGKSVVPAVNRVLENRTAWTDKIPTVASNAKPTLLQRAASLGLGAGTVAFEPHAALHIGINAARNSTAHSSIGKRFMTSQLKKGVGGAPLSRGAELATDTVLSPAALDSRRLGSALRADALAGSLSRLKSLAGQASELPVVAQKIEGKVGVPVQGLRRFFGRGMSGVGSALRRLT